MARDARGIIDKIFADTGDVADPSFSFAEGWPSTYSEAGGETPEREVFNKLFQVLFALGYDMSRFGGALPWDAVINYAVPAVVSGANGKLYLAVKPSGPGVVGGAVKPVDDVDGDFWVQVGNAHARDVAYDGTTAGLNADNVQTALDELVSREPGQATTKKAGLVEQATQSEVNAGTDAARYVSPKTLKDWSGGFDGTVTLRSTRSATGTWTITGLTIGKPMIIGVAANNGALPWWQIRVLSGANMGRSTNTSYPYFGGRTAGPGQDTSNGVPGFILIPAKPNVSIAVQKIQGATIYAYQ